MFDVHRDGDTAVLVATKDYEGLNRLSARCQLDDLLDGGVSRFVLDLSLLKRIDSSALGSIMVAFHRTRKAGGDLCLCGLNATIREVFEMTKLQEVITIHDSRETAVAALQA